MHFWRVHHVAWGDAVSQRAKRWGWDASPQRVSTVGPLKRSCIPPLCFSTRVRDVCAEGAFAEIPGGSRWIVHCGIGERLIPMAIGVFHPPPVSQPALPLP